MHAAASPSPRAPFRACARPRPLYSHAAHSPPHPPRSLSRPLSRVLSFASPLYSSASISACSSASSSSLSRSSSPPPPATGAIRTRLVALERAALGVLAAASGDASICSSDLERSELLRDERPTPAPETRSDDGGDCCTLSGSTFSCESTSEPVRVPPLAPPSGGCGASGSSNGTDGTTCRPLVGGARNVRGGGADAPPPPAPAAGGALPTTTISALSP
mmetsp:Transcript_68518/g.187836  ORF Transcript_68518/g.187836 Transcript_68518/m.187836 type:complete len:219 (-) Transcript_68518:1326-1982(-)